MRKRFIAAAKIPPRFGDQIKKSAYKAIIGVLFIKFYFAALYIVDGVENFGAASFKRVFQALGAVFRV